MRALKAGLKMARTETAFEVVATSVELEQKAQT
jgi:hypothetical protein